MSDQCFRFLLRERGVRAVGVRLKAPYQAVLGRGDYPAPVARWLGESSLRGWAGRVHRPQVAAS